MIRFATFNNIVHLTSVIIVIAAILNFIVLNHKETESAVKDPLVFISVVSAREHNEHRRAIRETWGKWTKTAEAELRFAIGQECRVPPDDREFDQGCTEIIWPCGANYDQTFWSNTFTSALPTSRTAKGFAFIVNFPVVLNSVKLARWGQTEGQTMVTVVNAHTQEQLDSLQFSAFSQNEAELTAKPYVLPRGFEGTVYVVGDFQPSNISCHHWTDYGNFIKPTWLIDNDLTLPVDSNDICEPVALSFQFVGVEKFVQERGKRLQEWNEKLTTISIKLDEENKEHGDLLFLDTVDVYRNLTSKILDVLQWTARHRKNSFLLKADDDTYVDFRRLENHIRRISNEVRDQVWWWVDLKVYWAVARYGKWRDNVYLSTFYPPFPCGAAYVISPHFVSLLGKNATFLTKYPFEDTALGLWSHSANLSPVLGRSDECAMDCGTRQPDCNKASCFILQCRPEEMERFMRSHDQRGNSEFAAPSAEFIAAALGTLTPPNLAEGAARSPVVSLGLRSETVLSMFYLCLTNLVLMRGKETEYTRGLLSNVALG